MGFSGRGGKRENSGRKVKSKYGKSVSVRLPINIACFAKKLSVSDSDLEVLLKSYELLDEVKKVTKVYSNELNCSKKKNNKITRNWVKCSCILNELNSIFKSYE